MVLSTEKVRNTNPAIVTKVQESEWMLEPNRRHTATHIEVRENRNPDHQDVNCFLAALLSVSLVRRK